MKRSVILILPLILFNTGIFARGLKPNVIIFIADDVSWDDFGCYGNRYVQTPHIDKLAGNGLKFTQLYLTASSCSPSRNSIMTGRYPHNTGAAELHTQPPLSMLSFPEVLRQHGYYSATSGKFHMGDYAKRGFDEIISEAKKVGNGGEDMWVAQVAERPKDKPFFMWFAAHDAHRAWGPNEFAGTHQPDGIEPPGYLADGLETRIDLGMYYDEITRFDHFVGEVVKELEAQEVLENTLLIIMSDNGRPFPHSKTRVNDRGMKTPFVVHWPAGISQSGTCQSLVSAIDIAPTILSLAGAEIPGQFQGRSFEKLFREPGARFRNYVFAEHNWHDFEAHGRMVRNEEFMYILNARPLNPQSGPADAVGSSSYRELVALKDSGRLTAVQSDVFVVPRPREELYDLSADPGQYLNVASLLQYKEALQHLRGVLSVWMDDTGDNTPENLTKDWYLREPGSMRTPHHNIRGEMPGVATGAVSNNNKSPF
jgi:N-sulfoglucosamine sulfohydrolase